MKKRRLLRILIASSALVVLLLITIIVSAVKSGKREDVTQLDFSDKNASRLDAMLDEETATDTEEETSEETETETTEVTEEETTEEETTEATTVKEYSLEDDKEAPVFLTFTKDVNIKVGDNFDIHKYIGYADDIDREVELSVTGEVDTKTAGAYPLKVTITDDTGKSTTWDMKVNVLTEMPSGGGAGPERFAWSDFQAKYKTDDNMLGIDVSRWQEDVDFTKVKAAGCEFVIMRLGGLDNGTLYVDSKFEQNYRNAKAAGLKIGIYWAAEESNAEEIKASVKYLTDVLGGDKLDFPIAYDWEDFMNFENYGMNLYDFNNLVPLFAAEVEKYGDEASLYSSKNFLKNVWTVEDDHQIWLAHYINQTDYTGDYYMWQLSSVGQLDGIGPCVDFDIYYKKQE